MTALVFPDWKTKIAYSPNGPQRTILSEHDRARVILVGLEAGLSIPAHPESLAVYHFLDGSGWMVLDDEKVEVRAGTTVVAPEGTSRGVVADTRLAFLATRIA